MSSAEFLILADESAEWKIAGLRQLDRLLLALNEFAATRSHAPTIAIDWKTPARPLPNELRNIRVVDSADANARVLTTHLFLHRNGLKEYLENTGRTWQLVASPDEIADTEKRFLRRTGKPQDGFVSKWINRPLTRPLTRQLLKFPITPTAWTLAIFPLPILAAALLWRGYFVTGVAVYQLYSMLDGCDGEIARAKYLESKTGGKVDDLCDIIGAVLFVTALGHGLGSFYAFEGIALAFFIGTNEWLLRIPSTQTSAPVSDAAYPRHRRLLAAFENSFIARVVVQLTKRDVGILLFLVLTLVGLPQWILHPWLAVTLLTLALNAISHLRARA